MGMYKLFIHVFEINAARARARTLNTVMIIHNLETLDCGNIHSFIHSFVTFNLAITPHKIH